MPMEDSGIVSGCPGAEDCASTVSAAALPSLRKSRRGSPELQPQESRGFWQVIEWAPRDCIPPTAWLSNDRRFYREGEAQAEPRCSSEPRLGRSLALPERCST